jgi:hypothetical protein
MPLTLLKQIGDENNQETPMASIEKHSHELL